MVDSSHFPLSVRWLMNLGVAMRLYWIAFIGGAVGLLFISHLRYRGNGRRGHPIGWDAGVVRRGSGLICCSCGGEFRFWSRWLRVCSLEFVESVVHRDCTVGNHLVVVRSWALHLVDERGELVRISFLKTVYGEGEGKERGRWMKQSIP